MGLCANGVQVLPDAVWGLFYNGTRVYPTVTGGGLCLNGVRVCELESASISFKTSNSDPLFAVTLGKSRDLKTLLTIKGMVWADVGFSSSNNSIVSVNADGIVMRVKASVVATTIRVYWYKSPSIKLDVQIRQ
jgi:hypothetical protein